MRAVVSCVSTMSNFGHRERRRTAQQNATATIMAAHNVSGVAMLVRTAREAKYSDRYGDTPPGLSDLPLVSLPMVKRFQAIL